MARNKASWPSTKVIVTFVLGFALGLGGVRLATGTSLGACSRAAEGWKSNWRVVWSPEHHCVSLADPYVADSGDLESSARPRLTGDPAEVLRTLHPSVRALDPGIGGVTTVRFDLTGDGVVRNPRVVGSSGVGAMDEAIAAIASEFAFAPGTATSGPAGVTMEYVVGFEADTRGRLVRWLSAIGD